MRNLFAGMAAAFLIGNTGAAAQPADYLLAYKAFTEAREAGDTERAIETAETAWRLAEESGQADGETLAILVQNFVNAVVWSEPARAFDALDRALDLAEEGHGTNNMALDELRLLKAYAELEADPSDVHHRAAMHEAAIAYAQAERPADELGTKALLNGGFRLFALGDTQRAYDLGTIQARALERVDDAPTVLLANTDQLRIVAMISENRRWRRQTGGRPKVHLDYERRLRNAHVLVDHAIARFPPAATLDDIDPLAASMHAWHAVLSSLEKTFDVEPDPEWAFEGRTLLESAPELVVHEGADGERIDCGEKIEWHQRTLRYPAAAEKRGLNGGALIGYDLSTEGYVENARLLAEVPSGEFGPRLLEQVKRWRADPSSVPSGCRTDLTSAAVFTMRR